MFFVSQGLYFYRKIKAMKTYAVTGTFHGSIIYADSEGEARRIFHKFYGGESITYLVKKDYFILP